MNQMKGKTMTRQFGKGVVLLLSTVVYVLAFYLATFIQSVFIPHDWP
jgi:hypothetical protein